MKMNKHYNELKASYLFVDIAHKVAAYQEAHPEKEIIRLGIGDVTQPLAKCVVKAMHDAADEMARSRAIPSSSRPFRATTQAAAPSWQRMKFSSLMVQRAIWPTYWACSMWTTPCWCRTPFIPPTWTIT